MPDPQQQTNDAARFGAVLQQGQTQQPDAPATTRTDDASRFGQVIQRQQQIDSQQPQQAPQQPGFLDRLWEGSGAKAMWDGATAKARQQHEEDVAVRDQAISQLKAHDFGGAVETLAKHIGKRALPPPYEIGKGIIDNSVSHGKAAVQSLRAGDTGGAAEHTAEAVPILGPAVHQFAKPLGEDIATGNKAGVAGDIAGGAVQAGLALLGGEGAEAEAGDAALAGEKALPEVSREAVKSQIVKDAIKRTLGSKADSAVVDEAFSRMKPQNIWDRAVSPVENELKLVKPKLNADMNVLNKRLDTLLGDSGAEVEGTATHLNTMFDELAAKAKAGVGDPAEADAIEAVRQRVLPKVTDEPMSVTDVNNLKRIVGDQIKNFQPPELLNSTAKAEQEAYRQSYFSLRDLVSDAVPESKVLNMKISRGFDLQDLLEKKFPQLETPEQAAASYKGTRQQGVKNVVVKGAKATGILGGGTYAAKKVLGD